MLNEAEKHRYNRHLILDGFGEQSQLKLKSSKVAVIGAGGLGAPVLQYLVAAGVGTIGIIDGDVVSESNLQRQVIFDTTDLKKSKVEAARDRLMKQNPLINIVAHNTFLTTENTLDILGEYDLVIDGTDNFQTRYLVGDATSILKKPLVFGSIFKFEGQVSVFNMEDGPGYRCLYPDPPAPEEVPNCSEVGVLGVLPGVVGSIMANEAVKVLANIGDPLVGRLLIYDGLKMTFSELKFKQTSEPIQKLMDNYDEFCGVKSAEKSINVIQLKEKLSKEQVVLLDVREPHEVAICTLDSIHVPMNLVAENMSEIPKDKNVVVYCHHGMRSQMVIKFLEQQGYDNLTNLEGGIHQWALNIDPQMATY